MTTDKDVPISLVVDQIKAYRYAFMEAVLRANVALKQRDYFHDIALKAQCDAMSELNACPSDADDPCPAAFGVYCTACRKAVEEKAKYL